jgi:hypothetical protein
MRCPGRAMRARALQSGRLLPALVPALLAVPACSPSPSDLPEVQLRPTPRSADAWTTDADALALRDSLRALALVPRPEEPNSAAERRFRGLPPTTPDRPCELMPNAWSDLPLCRGG